MTTNKTVILADGDFPTSPAALKIFEEAEYLCCCDGATAKALAADRIPDAIVGDLDSLSPELRERFADRTHQITEQETNDLSKAFYYCASIERFDVDILGAVGRREDHMLGNIARLAEFAQTAPNIRMITDFGVFQVALKSGSFPSTPGEQISIFSFDPQQEITSSGLMYPLNRLRLPRWDRATLNEALGTEFTLEFDSDSPLLLYFANEIRKR